MKRCQRLTLPPPGKLAILDGRTPALTYALHDSLFFATSTDQLAKNDSVFVFFFFVFTIFLNIASS